MNLLENNGWSFTYQGIKYQWNQCLGSINGMQIYKGEMINLATRQEDRIIIKICQNKDQNFIDKLTQISEVQQISGFKIISVLKTVRSDKLLQINDYYEQTLDEYQDKKRKEQSKEDIIKNLKDVVLTISLISQNQFVHGNINKQTIVYKDGFRLAHFENFQKSNSQNTINYGEMEKIFYIKPPETKLSCQTDVFQLGVVFYMIYTNEKQFNHEILERYEIDPFSILIKNMTVQDTQKRYDINRVSQELYNINYENQQLKWTQHYKQFNSHLTAWKFLFDAYLKFNSFNLIQQDQARVQYLQILSDTIQYHKIKLEYQLVVLNENFYQEFNSDQSVKKDLDQYERLANETNNNIAQFNKDQLSPAIDLEDLQRELDKNQKIYLIQTLQLSNNIYHLHQLDSQVAQSIDELKLCIRLFFCVPLQYLHINVKGLIVQFEEIQKLGYKEIHRVLSQQISQYLKKLYEY